jgi:CRP-like cAMP-binding protein
MDEKRIAFLQQIPLFGGVRSEIVELLLESSRTVVVAQGEYFFREGDGADSLFVLESGQADVLKIRDGELRLLRRLHKGECFGEMAIMDLMPRSASVVAVEDCVAIELPPSALVRVFEQDVEQFALIEMNMGREVSRRLRAADEKMSVGDPTDGARPHEEPGKK